MFSLLGIDLVRFTNLVTESNTTTLATIVVITGRKKILVFSLRYNTS